MQIFQNDWLVLMRQRSPFKCDKSSETTTNFGFFFSESIRFHNLKATWMTIATNEMPLEMRHVLRMWVFKSLTNDTQCDGYMWSANNVIVEWDMLDISHNIDACLANHYAQNDRSIAVSAWVWVYSFFLLPLTIFSFSFDCSTKQCFLSSAHWMRIVIIVGLLNT